MLRHKSVFALAERENEKKKHHRQKVVAVMCLVEQNQAY